MSIRQGDKVIAGAVDGVRQTGDTMTGNLKITNPGRPYSVLDLKGNEVIWDADQVYDTNKYLGQIHFLDKNDNWGGYLQCWKDKYDAVGIGFGARRKEGNNADVALYQRKDGSTGFYIDGKELSSFCCEKKYNSDGSWYRRYSDGWLEQGGIANGIPSSGVVKNLVKAYKNTNYTIIIQCINKNVVTYNDGQVFCNNKTTTNFRLSAYASPNANWYACGQGA